MPYLHEPLYPSKSREERPNAVRHSTEMPLNEQNNTGVAVHKVQTM